MFLLVHIWYEVAKGKGKFVDIGLSGIETCWGSKPSTASTTTAQSIIFGNTPEPPDYDSGSNIKLMKKWVLLVGFALMLVTWIMNIIVCLWKLSLWTNIFYDVSGSSRERQTYRHTDLYFISQYPRDNENQENSIHFQIG